MRQEELARLAAYEKAKQEEVQSMAAESRQGKTMKPNKRQRKRKLNKSLKKSKDKNKKRNKE